MGRKRRVNCGNIWLVSFSSFFVRESFSLAGNYWIGHFEIRPCCWLFFFWQYVLYRPFFVKTKYSGVKNIQIKARNESKKSTNANSLSTDLKKQSGKIKIAIRISIRRLKITVFSILLLCFAISSLPFHGYYSIFPPKNQLQIGNLRGRNLGCGAIHALSNRRGELCSPAGVQRTPLRDRIAIPLISR